MRWMSDLRRETEWEEWFAWHAVPVETLCTGSRIIYADEELKMVRWERIERRKVALPNAQFTYIYRAIGSDWDDKKLGAPPSSGEPDAPLDRKVKNQHF